MEHKRNILESEKQENPDNCDQYSYKCTYMGMGHGFMSEGKLFNVFSCEQTRQTHLGPSITQVWKSVLPDNFSTF